jgi:predicted nucleotidyltransferase
MRLKPEEIMAIRESVEDAFGTDTPVWLFGSRVDDAQRGGDIDLFLETERPPADRLQRKFRLLALLQARLGEQKIDLVLADPRDPHEQNRPIVREAKATGVRLHAAGFLDFPSR